MSVVLRDWVNSGTSGIVIKHAKHHTTEAVNVHIVTTRKPSYIIIISGTSRTYLSITDRFLAMSLNSVCTHRGVIALPIDGSVSVNHGCHIPT